MALTLVEKEKIRNLLGYPSNYRFKNTRLESVLESDVSDELEVLVRSWLVTLDNIEAQAINVATTTTIATGGLKRVEDIEWYPTSTTKINGGIALQKTIQNWQRVYAGKISIALGVPFYSDAFGPGGYEGDSFSEFGLSSKNNIIPLG